MGLNVHKRHFLLLAIFIGFFIPSKGQNVAINSTGNAPAASAMLDITETGKGILIPRMTLANRPASPATSLLIYQTDNTPGYYYYNGSAWVPLLTSLSAWSLTGNTGTTAGTNYLGTKDATDLVLSTAGTERVRINGVANAFVGFAGFGTNDPQQRLHVADDIILGGGQGGTEDGATEHLKFWAESKVWNIGVINDAASANSDFFISQTDGVTDGTFHLEPSGHIGIGTATPTSWAKLHVEIDDADDAVYIKNTNATSSTDAVFRIDANSGAANAFRIQRNTKALFSSISGASDVGTPTGMVTVNVSGELGKKMVTFPTGGVVLWERPAGQSYIQPEGNSNVRVYDNSPVQPYGLYYDGSTNTVAAYFRTTSTVSGTAAVEGFSDITGTQTKGYLGYVSSSIPGTSAGGTAVYGSVTQPNRIALYGQTSGTATYAAIIGYSSIWGAGFYSANYAGTDASGGPYGLYGELDVSNAAHTNAGEAVIGYSTYSGTGDPGTTVGGRFTALGGTESSAGVTGVATSTGNANVALLGSATGASSINYGVYAVATGATTNWSGWFDSDVNVEGDIGIGGVTINSQLHVNSSAAENSLRAQVNGSTKLLVHSNGGVVIGANSTPPAGGIQLGDATTDDHRFWGDIISGSSSDGHRILSNSDDYGLIGISGLDWWEGYAVDWITTSNREEKRDIHYLDNTDYEVLMSDIEKTPLAFYNYKVEEDQLIEGKEVKYAATMHLGTFTDEAPDYVMDNTAGGIRLYGYTSLALAGVKYNRNSIKQLEEKVSDFGSTAMMGTEMWVNFSTDFSDELSPDQLPVVTITPNNPMVTLSISEKTNLGFKIVASQASANLLIDWIAMGRKSSTPPLTDEQITNRKTELNLTVSPEVKKLMKDWAKREVDAVNANYSQPQDPEHADILEEGDEPRDKEKNPGDEKIKQYLKSADQPVKEHKGRD